MYDAVDSVLPISSVVFNTDGAEQVCHAYNTIPVCCRLRFNRFIICKVDPTELQEIQAARKEHEVIRRKGYAPHLAWGRKHPSYDPDPNSKKRASWTDSELSWILKEFVTIEEQFKVTLFICIYYRYTDLYKYNFRIH